MKDHWEKESPAVRDEMKKQAKEENVTNLNEWKQKAAFVGTAKDLHKYDNLQSYDLICTKWTSQGMGGFSKCQEDIC